MGSEDTPSREDIIERNRRIVELENEMYEKLVMAMLHVVMEYVHVLPRHIIVDRVKGAADYVAERVRAVKQGQA